MKRSIRSRLLANCSERDTTTRRSSIKKRLALYACVFACCVVSVLGVRAYNSREPAPNRTLDHDSREPAPNRAVDYSSRKLAPDASLIKPATKAAEEGPVPVSGPPSAAAAVKPLQQSNQIEVELITVTPDGLQPKEITRPQGRFVIAIENRSGQREVSLRLDRGVGSRLIDTEMRKENLNVKYLTDLSPGVYALTEANHPDWICRFTITPR